MLLRHKADVKSLDACKNTPLVLAVDKGHLDTVKVLIGAKADIDPATVLAALTSSDSGVKDFVFKGDALTSATDEAGNTALHLAAMRKETDGAKALIEILKESGGDPNKGVDKQAKNGLTPLMASCRAGAMRITCELIKAGASVQKRDLKGNTPLHYTYGEDPETLKAYHNTKIYQVLVSKCGADPEATNDAGEKPKKIEDAMRDEEADQEMSENCQQQ